MSLAISVNISGNKDLIRRLEEYPKVATKAARLAINDTVRKGNTWVKREVQKRANLPPSYVNARIENDFARGDDLRGRIVGRYRATSLSRFEAMQLRGPKKTGPGKKNTGVSVKVRNVRKRIPRAFLMKLKGAQDKSNVGLAIRLNPGESVKRRFIGKPLYAPGSQSASAARSSDVYLLYGPSVHQIMTSNVKGKSVIEQLQPDLNEYLNAQFERQFGRLSNA